MGCSWLDGGDKWRKIVEFQPTAVACRDTLIANIANLEWVIEAKDSNQRDELKPEIEKFTKLLEFSGELDYIGLVEWLGKDYLDLPFGGAVEVIREYDKPDGEVLYLVPLDGATCFPTENFNFPVGQTNGTEYVYFPVHAIDRLYMSPRTNMDRYGWGCAPPEKIIMSMQMLNRGDVYYASLLLDTPQVGLLDLMDMSKESATEWVAAWKTMLQGIDPFKIPVLYEHTSKAEFVSFTRSPTEVMFDKALSKYVILTCAGYGLSTSDIGMPSSGNGGETLAGSIRQERRTRRTGYALFKKKLTYFFNRLLPDTLRFHFIDLDDELNVAIGRARLSTAQAMDILAKIKMITPNEGRQQMVADGLFTISMPETIEGGDKPVEAPAPFGSSVGGGSKDFGRPVSPSQGGFGEKSLVKNLQDESEELDIFEQELYNLDTNTEQILEEQDNGKD